MYKVRKNGGATRKALHSLLKFVGYACVKPLALSATSEVVDLASYCYERKLTDNLGS